MCATWTWSMPSRRASSAAASRARSLGGTDRTNESCTTPSSRRSPYGRTTSPGVQSCGVIVLDLSAEARGLEERPPRLERRGRRRRRGGEEDAVLHAAVAGSERPDVPPALIRLQRLRRPTAEVGRVAARPLERPLLRPELLLGGGEAGPLVGERLLGERDLEPRSPTGGLERDASLVAGRAPRRRRLEAQVAHRVDEPPVPAGRPSLDGPDAAARRERGGEEREGEAGGPHRASTSSTSGLKYPGPRSTTPASPFPPSSARATSPKRARPIAFTSPSRATSSRSASARPSVSSARRSTTPPGRSVSSDPIDLHARRT